MRIRRSAAENFDDNTAACIQRDCIVPERKLEMWKPGDCRQRVSESESPYITCMTPCECPYAQSTSDKTKSHNFIQDAEASQDAAEVLQSLAQQ